MKTLLAISLLTAFQASPLDEFYKFKVGTLWTYKRVEDGAERKITGEVTEVKDGKVILSWKDPDKDGTSTVTWSVAEGILTIAAGKDGGAELVFSLLKEGSKKDDKWPSAGGEVTHLGPSEVTVPAGTYKNAVCTRFKANEDGVEVDFYLAPKAGLVKAEVRTKNGGPNTFELAEFKEPKK